MNNHEKYQLTFSALTPTFSAAEIRSRAKAKGKSFQLKRLWIPAAAAVILASLIVSVSAFGLAGNWLGAFLNNAGEHPELAEKTVSQGASEVSEVL